VKTGSIALVVIVKNEAERIVSLLTHHKGLAQEMIVLDTGSTDETVALARSAGATVHFFEWCDDFSAARNAALAYSKSHYALCIDADERIAASDFGKLQEAAKQHRQCYVMTQRNYYSNPQHPAWKPVSGEFPEEEEKQAGYFEAQNTKFFDLSCGLQFEARVHESVIASAKRNNVAIVPLDVPIHHYGYVISEQHNQDRNVRYLHLLEQKYSETPNDAQTVEEYATALIQVGQIAEAMPLLKRLNASAQTNEAITRARLLLAQLIKAQGRADEAEAIYRRAVQQAPDHFFAHLHLLRHLAGEEKFRDMSEYLKDAQKRFGEHPQLLQVQSRYLILTNQIHEAARVTRKVAELFPALPAYSDLASRLESLSLKLREVDGDKGE